MNQRSVETFVVHEVKEERLDGELLGFEPGRAYVDQLLADCPFVYTFPERQDSLPFNDPSPYTTQAHTAQLIQTTPNHRRAFEVRDPKVPETWQDEYGHFYSSLGLKGNAFNHAELIDSSTATERVIAYGLQESAVIQRVVRASNMMRAAGVDTEHIVGLAEPTHFDIPIYDSMTDQHTEHSLVDYKAELVTRRWNTLPDSERTPEELARLHTAVGRMTFYVSARAMDVSLRLNEIPHYTSERERLFALANQHFLPEGAVPLDYRKSVDTTRLLREVTVPRLSRNLARLHAHGLAHRYPNGMNVTALGSIVDADSVHGEPLGFGDDPITAEDVFKDIIQVMRGITETDDSTMAIKRFREVDIDQLDERQQGTLEQLLAIYRVELSKFSGAPITTSMIAEVAGRHTPEDDDIANPFIPGERMLAREIFHAFKDPQPVVESDVLAEEANAWLAENQGNMREKIEQYVLTSGDLIADITFDEFINELRDGSLTHLVDAFIDAQGVKWKSHASALDALLDGVEMMMIDAFEKARHGEEKRDIATTEQLTRQLVSSEAATFRSVGADLLEQAMVNNTGWLREQLTFAPHTPFVSGDYDSYELARSRERTLLFETNGVELEDLLEAGLSKAPELAGIYVKKFVPELDKMRVLMGEDDARYIQPIDPENTITELITDGILDGVSYSNLDTLEQLSIGAIEDGSYVASVERTPEGKLILQIRLVEHGFKVDDMTATTPESIQRLLEKFDRHYPRQLQLSFS